MILFGPLFLPYFPFGENGYPAKNVIAVRLFLEKM